MKRFITMLVALVATICLAPGAMAELDTSKCYYLKDTGINQYVVIPATAGTSNYITPSTTDKTPVAFKKVTGGYSMQSATSEVYIGIDSWNAVGSTVALAWEISEVEGGITIKNTSGDYSGKWFGGQPGKTKFYNNNGSAITFTLEVAEGVNPPTGEPAAETRVNVMGAYLKNLSGDYFGASGVEVGIVSEPFAWNLEYVVGAPKAYTIKGVTLARWINSGSNGYLSTADNKSNARSFYFYEVGEGTTGTLVEQPVAGKKYIVAVANIKDGVKGLYALYGQVVATNTARMDVIKIQDGEVTTSNLPEAIDLSTHATTVAGVATDNNKAIWQIKLPAKQVVTGTDDSVITEGWYQIQVGSGTGFQHPDYKDYYLAGFTRSYNSNNWQALVPDGDDLRTYVYITGSHDAFNIQYRKGGSGSLATYYANYNATSTTTAPNNLHFIPSADGSEWRIQGNGSQNWMGWNLGGPAVGGTSTASYNNNYFKLTKINELPEAVAPEVGKSYRIAILRSNGVKMYIKGTGVTEEASGADVLTVGESGDTDYPMTFVTKGGDYLTNQGVRSGMSGNVIAFKGGVLSSSSSSYVKCPDVIKGATYYLTAKARWNSASQTGNIILKEADNSYNNSAEPYMDGSFSSALLFEEITAPLANVTYKYYLDSAAEPIKTEVLENQLSGQAPAAAPFSSPFATVSDNHAELLVSEDGTTEVRVDVTQNLPFEVTTDPSTPKYGVLRMHSNENRYGYVSEDGKAKCVTAYLSSENSRYLWYIMGNVLEGFKLYSELGAMKATATQSTVDTEGEGTNWELRAGTVGTTMKTNLFSLYNEDVKYMNSRPSGDILYWTSNDAGSTFQLIQDVEVSVSEVGYATFYYQYPVSVPEEVSAYTMSENGEYLTATKVTTIPVGVGVVLQAEQGDYTFPVAKTADCTSCLSGTYTAKSSTEADGNYVFSIVNENPGFYKFGGENLAANKAYYHPTSAEVQGFVIDFGGITTGINTAQQAQGQKASFDLQGRRVSKAVRGLYIQNGVKVIK